MANSTTDHEVIRKWAEGKGGKPASVGRTHQGGDVGIIRIMFPESPQSEHQSLVEISWDEFFEQFEESELALIYSEDSLFSKIVGRDTLEHREHGEHVSRHHGGSSSSHQDNAAQAHHARETEAQHGGRGPASHSQDRPEHKSGPKSEGPDDLKSREYRDKDGKVHHHTRTYEEQQDRKK
jgi:hypothetical protein